MTRKLWGCLMLDFFRALFAENSFSELIRVLFMTTTVNITDNVMIEIVSMIINLNCLLYFCVLLKDVFDLSVVCWVSGSIKSGHSGGSIEPVSVISVFSGTETCN